MPGERPACRKYCVGAFAAAPHVKLTESPLTAAVNAVGAVGTAARSESAPTDKSSAVTENTSFKRRER